MRNEHSTEILHLLIEKRVKPSRFIEIYRKNSGNIKKTLNYFYRYEQLNIGGKRAKNFKFDQGSSCYDKTLGFILKNKIGLLDIGQKDYPDILRQIYCPPPLLFYKGNKIKSAGFCVAVVGSRKCSVYGREAAEYISRNLSRIGITVVSGLAIGIDACAQKAALREKGGSIGVLGCGIDVIYPPENRNLFKNIQENGSIVTEFLPKTPPLRSNFPVRNRIISGLCMGVAVIEAGDRSGAIITGEMALKQNREVFAVPGSIFSPLSRGCHKLIKSGAKLTSGIDDILEEFSYHKDIALNISSDISNKSRCDKIKKDENGLIKKLTSDESRVYESIGCKPKSIEEIVKCSGLEVSSTLRFLTSLEIKKLIKEDGFNKYSRLF
jgi:DNA processing protein